MTTTPTLVGVPDGNRELRAILSIAAPLALAQIAQMVMGVTDAIWMGHIGTDALAAGGLGSNMSFMLLVVLSGVLQSIQPIVAGGRGAGDHTSFGRTLAAGLVISALAAVPIIVVLLRADRCLIAVGAPPDIARMTLLYEQGFVWGVPAWFVQAALRNYLAALGRTRVILAVALVGCVANFGLNWALIFGHLGLPALGLSGSGYATAIVCWAMTLSTALYVWGAGLFPADLSRLKWPAIRRGIREVIAIGWPISGIWAFEIGLFSGSMILMSYFGPVALAAHQICMNLCSLTYMVPFAIGTAATVRVGFHTGAGMPERARRAGFISLALAVGFMVIAAAAMRLFANEIFHFYLSPSDPLLPAVTALGGAMIPLAVTFQVFDGVQAVAAGALRGLQDTRAPLVAAIVGYWFLGGPVGWLLAFGLGFGAVGIWWGFTLGLIIMAIVLTLRFRERIERRISAARKLGIPIGWQSQTDAAA